MPGRNDPCPCGSGRKYKKCCGKTVTRPPKDPEVEPEQPTARDYLDLGNRMARQERPNAAMMAWQEALKLRPDYLPALENMGKALVIKDRPEEAIPYLQQAAELDTEGTENLRRLASAQEMVGDLEGARLSAEKALECNREDVGALLLLTNLLKKDLPEDYRERMEAMLERSTGLSDKQRRQLHFALMNLYTSMKDYEAASRHSRRANAIDKAGRVRAGTQFVVEQFEKMVEAQLRYYTPEYMEKVRPYGSSSRRPIFVIGLPRSGTTLTERVLGKHPKVHPAGELPDIAKAYNALPHIVHRNLPPYECIPILAEQGAPITKMADFYLQRLDVYDKDHEHVIDKACNGMQMGLIFTMFPEARVIYVRRDIRDVAISCWLNQFQKVAWACDFEWLATHFRGHARVMPRWYELFGDRILTVRYEDMVEDLEGQARRMSEFLELDWDPAMLKFYEDGGAVRTASVRQVRQPVYKGSLGRWKYYEPYLPELFEAVSQVEIPPDTGAEAAPAEAAEQSV
ncbi:MAG: sulfotransferase [Phycisphaerae bacterium]